MAFKDFIFGQFPPYYKIEDTNKDGDGKGIFERYTEIYGEYIDESIIPDIENFSEDFNALSCRETLLPIIADDLGNPPELTIDDDRYRKLLSTIASIYKIKGTLPGYRIFFLMFGFNVSINTYQNIDIVADLGFKSDEGYAADNYCNNCTSYEIAFWNNNDNAATGNLTLIDSDTLDALNKIISFNEPINARLLGFYQNVKVDEKVDICVQEDISIEVFQSAIADNGLVSDNGIVADGSNSVFLTSVTNNPCAGAGGIGTWVIEHDFIVQ